MIAGSPAASLYRFGIEEWPGPMSAKALGRGGRMRRRGSGIGALLLIIWLAIGAIAAAQRGYFGSSDTSCATAATIAVTIVAGPLNYVGANPQVNCQLPQPSQ
jgi:hypothetical protein